MQRVSIRTLALMVELLIAVVALQYRAPARPVRAGAVWLAGNGAGAMPAPSEANDCTIEI